MPRLRVRKPSALYRCSACDDVVRLDPGHSPVCMCEALPLGSDPGPKLGPSFGMGRIGPWRPYYHDREHPMVEIEDDGRLAKDLRGGIWLA